MCKQRATEGGCATRTWQATSASNKM